MTYSQGDEESIILGLEGDGRYLEIGSYDGCTFSNTRALAEKGWTGVCVEPAAHAFDCMTQNPPPGAELVNCLIGPFTGLVPFHYCQDALSSTSEKHARKWRKVADFTPIWAMQLSLNDLLETFPGPYRLVSIDTESTSLDLLRLIEPRLDDLETEMVVVEHDGSQVNLQGFKEIHRTGENSIQVRR